MDLDELAKQYQGRKFGEIVLQQCKAQNLPTTMAAIRGLTEELPPSAHISIESWIDKIMPLGAYGSFWEQDCGEVFLGVCDEARTHLTNIGVNPTNDNIFNMFLIIVLSFAYTAHISPPSKAVIQKAIGVGFLGKLFG